MGAKGRLEEQGHNLNKSWFCVTKHIAVWITLRDEVLFNNSSKVTSRRIMRAEKITESMGTAPILQR